MLRTSYRSLLAVILAMMTALLVSCSSPATKAPPTYTAEQLVQIQNIAAPVVELRDKISTLETQIFDRNWTDVRSFIHGPLGELRQKMSNVTRVLLPKEQQAAREAAKDMFAHLQSIDLAASTGNYQKAVENYRAAVKDFNTFLQLIPGSDSGVAS
jgi:photosystem II protein PsbQ